MQSNLCKPIDVAIIMDGNGRWATQRGLPRSAGHNAGVSALRNVVEAALTQNINSLTVYAFSSDNWKRPQREITALMGLLRRYLQRDLARLVENDVRVTVIGRRDRLPADIIAYIRHAEAVTKGGRGLHLRIALDYSARNAIVTAADRCGPDEVTEKQIARNLQSDEGPPKIDFLIRTGGEKRLSDFLLWEAAYAELYFTDLLWPDFDGESLAVALTDFHDRDRRYGGLPTHETINSPELTRQTAGATQFVEQKAPVGLR